MKLYVWVAQRLLLNLFVKTIISILNYYKLFILNFFKICFLIYSILNRFYDAGSFFLSYSLMTGLVSRITTTCVGEDM